MPRLASITSALMATTLLLLGPTNAATPATRTVRFRVASMNKPAFLCLIYADPTYTNYAFYISDAPESLYCQHVISEQADGTSILSSAAFNIRGQPYTTNFLGWSGLGTAYQSNLFTDKWKLNIAQKNNMTELQVGPGNAKDFTGKCLSINDDVQVEVKGGMAFTDCSKNINSLFEVIPV